jgi:hypothetical protein
LAISAVAIAGKYSVSATYWRVTDIFETRTPEGVLTERELEFNCGYENIYVNFLSDDLAWSEVEKVQSGDWLWLNTGPDNRVVVFFGRMSPAQTELGNILK